MLFPQEGFNNRERGVRPCVGLQKDITRKDVSFDARDGHGCVSLPEGPDWNKQLRLELKDLNIGREFIRYISMPHRCDRSYKQHLQVQRNRQVFGTKLGSGHWKGRDGFSSCTQISLHLWVSYLNYLVFKTLLFFVSFCFLSQGLTIYPLVGLGLMR